MTPEATVFVVDDNPEVRESLHFLIESVGARVEAFPDAQSFLDAYRPGRPGCLILDVRMPGMSGLELQERLLELDSRLHIIFLSGHASVPVAVRAMREGAVDFFEKPVDEELLLDRIQHVLGEVARHERERVDQAVFAARLALLTPREHEVLELLVEGKRTKEIATQLNIGVRTAETHRAKVMEKMRAHSLGELIAEVLAHR